RFESYHAAYQYQIPIVVGHTDVHEGVLPAVHSFMSWEGEGLALSSVKMGEQYGDLVARWFNMDHTDRILTVQAPRGTWRKSDILERRSTEQIATDQDEWKLIVKPAEVITVAGDLKCREKRLRRPLG